MIAALLAVVLIAPGVRASPENATAQQLLASWKDEEPGCEQWQRSSRARSPVVSFGLEN
jgi:hypothetical protein